ncbi:MAG: hypothetical protein BWY04_01148 [candidate division CPR1 bacterium ADurb.Bin160]|uniref:Uncharacterized protein n=1 Tax=candidate division CPR1 bacterium ADurb.Bin160 TaxID=1852826 RepID=A0A1V5ZL78_9BACT|nr:MAG: hypothetical protein BWY04_01148 [candidate division CPR1 bacterium ADurb.Bin160]
MSSQLGIKTHIIECVCDSSFIITSWRITWYGNIDGWLASIFPTIRALWSTAIFVEIELWLGNIFPRIQIGVYQLLFSFISF